MKRALIIGEGQALEQALSTAMDAGLDCIRLELTSPDQHNFDLGVLFENHPATASDVFVALDERAINHARLKLIADVRLAGYRLLNIVSPRAVVAPDAKLLGNVHIGPGCNVAARCNLGTGSWLGQHVVVTEGVQIGNCATLLAGTLLGPCTQIGRGSTLGPGSVTLAHTKIGRHCEWLLPGTLPAVLPDYSFHDTLMPEGARILG